MNIKSKVEAKDSFIFREEYDDWVLVFKPDSAETHGIPVEVRVTIHQQNVQDLEAIARFLLEELELPELPSMLLMLVIAGLIQRKFNLLSRIE